jgi:hypothetical protein
MKTKEDAFREWHRDKFGDPAIIGPLTDWQEATIKQVFSAKPGDRLSGTISFMAKFLSEYPEPLMYFEQAGRGRKVRKALEIKE